MKMKNRMVDKSRNTPYDEAYKALRTNLEFLHTAQDLRVIYWLHRKNRAESVPLCRILRSYWPPKSARCC